METGLEGQRAVVSFARDEISKTLTFRPIPDLETEGDETWQVAAASTFFSADVGDGLEGLAQAHIVREDAAHAHCP